MTIDVDPTEPAYAHAYARAEKIIEGEGLEEHLMGVALRRERIELLAQRLHSTAAARAAARIEDVCEQIARRGARYVLAALTAAEILRSDEVLRVYRRAAGCRLGHRPPRSVRRRLAFERAYRDNEF